MPPRWDDSLGHGERLQPTVGLRAAPSPRRPPDATVARRPAPRDRGQLQFGTNADSAGAASVAHGPTTRRRHPPTGSREARHLRPPGGRATRAPWSWRLSDTTVVHARALCKISRPARGQWWRTDGRLRWRRAGSLQHRAPGALWSARSGASRHGRRKAVTGTAGAAGARSRLRKSQSNLPLGFTALSFSTVPTPP